MSADDVVTSDVADGVRTIRLNRPAKLNAMNSDLLAGVASAFISAAADPDTKVIVLTGNGRAFCAGGDLTTTLQERNDRLETTLAMSMRSVEVFSLMEWIPKPVIAMVNGDVYAGGLGFVVYSDLTLAAEGAGFCAPMATRGLFEPYLATRLAAKVGVERTKYMLFTARRITADQALAWGMVSEVHPLDDLADVTRELALQLASHSPYSLREYKYAVRRPLPGLDLGTFVHEAVAPETTAIMEAFAREFPAG